MLHKIPLGLAALVAYGIYVALGNDSCQVANRAVMPIHWVGAGLNYATNNFYASNNEASGNSVIKGVDSAAAYVRDGLLVLGQGKAFCTSFQASLITPSSVKASLQDSQLDPSQELAPASPLPPNGAPSPVFRPIDPTVPVFVKPSSKGSN